MIICKTENGIGLRWREGDEIQSKIVSHSDFQPYMYVLDDSIPVGADNFSFKCKDSHGSFNIKVNFCPTGEVSLEKRPLQKVTWTPNNPKYAKDVRIALEANNIKTFEADVPYHYRYAVDEIKEIPEQNLRRWYWDMEWQQGGKYDECITCIVIYDNYDDEYHVFAWYPEEGRDIVLKDNDSFILHRYNSEHNMLTGFLAFSMDKEPDMLISWFGWKFDIPKLFTRMVHHNIDPRLLSPFDEITGIGWKRNKPTIWKSRVEGYSPVTQPIKGMITVALDLIFERQWNDAQRGTLPSLSLDYVSENVLGDVKLVSEKFPDKNEFFRRAWLEDADTYLEYAFKDVELIKRIDEENHCIDAVLSLQRLLKAPFDACFYASNMGGIYFMRNAWWKAPTGEKGERREYEGAMIYNPLSEGTNGLHRNVAAFDFAGLYPSMIISRNISWETISEEPTDFAVNLAIPRDFSEVKKEEMMYFKTDELGLLPKAVLDLKELRDEYKKKMKEATTKDEYAKWNNNQLAVKRLSASFYGIIAYQGFGWANVDLAASITASAREAIRAAAFKVRDMNAN
tara:strand:+ start:4951 stop:6651 length:1701 start_codon:yes stop_codon:yes gene_type:complete